MRYITNTEINFKIVPKDHQTTFKNIYIKTAWRKHQTSTKFTLQQFEIDTEQTPNQPKTNIIAQTDVNQKNIKGNHKET